MSNGFNWTRRNVLNKAHVHGEVQTGSEYATAYQPAERLCKKLAAEGLLRSTGWCTYAITEAGREAAVGLDGPAGRRKA